MGRYLIKRIFIFIPTLLIISLLAFIISINAPGDPLDRLVSAQESSGEMAVQSVNTQQEKERWRKKLGLDLPVFYFSISNVATPDTMFRIYDDNVRSASHRLIAQYGNWSHIHAWQSSLHTLSGAITQLSVNHDLHSDRFSAVDTVTELFRTVEALRYAYEPNFISAQLNELEKSCKRNPFLAPMLPLVIHAQDAYRTMTLNPTKWKNFIPAIHIHGYNQYHRWLFGDGNWLTGKNATDCRGILRGDFGYSYETKLPVGNVIGDRIRWSLIFTVISVLLAYMISLPIGIRAAANKDSVFDRTSGVVLFILYSMPTFWVATLLLMTLANPLALQLFPASGIGPVTGIPEDAGWLETIRLRIPYLILPTIAYTYAQLAFLSRITRVSTLEIIAQDYIRTARAKGLSENTVIYKHAFRNALLPVITVFSNIFPMAIGGSVILETIFTIPGMGQQIFMAILNKDYPVIITVFTLTGVLTLIGYLVADILYALADPRISYANK